MNKRVLMALVCLAFGSTGQALAAGYPVVDVEANAKLQDIHSELSAMRAQVNDVKTNTDKLVGSVGLQGDALSVDVSKYVQQLENLRTLAISGVATSANESPDQIVANIKATFYSTEQPMSVATKEQLVTARAAAVHQAAIAALATASYSMQILQSTGQDLTDLAQQATSSTKLISDQDVQAKIALYNSVQTIEGRVVQTSMDMLTALEAIAGDPNYAAQ